MLPIISLSSELLVMVLRYLDNSTLKSARLTSRYLGTLSTSLLFETFSIFPHVRSFERFVIVAKTKHLARHIQNLDYDARWYRSTISFVHCVAEIVNVHDYTRPSAQKAIKAARLTDSMHL